MKIGQKHHEEQQKKKQRSTVCFRLLFRMGFVIWGSSITIFCYVLVRYSYSGGSGSGSSIRNDGHSIVSSASSSSSSLLTMSSNNEWWARGFRRPSSSRNNKDGGKGTEGVNVPAIHQYDDWNTLDETTDCTKFRHDVLRPDHGCEVNTDTRTVFCNFHQLRIDNTKIDVSLGGEPLQQEDVMGRPEEVELPKYHPGAFVVPTKPSYNVPTKHRKGLHYIENGLNSLKYPKVSDNNGHNHNHNNRTIDTTTCHQTFLGYTLFITRYEYVNWYHTLTDLWNAFFVLPTTVKDGRDVDPDNNNIDWERSEFFNGPHQVVFLDGHAQGGLDGVWKTMFGDYHYIQHLPKGGVCFERAIFIPAGYKSPLFTDIERSRCPDPTLGRTFSKFVLNKFQIDPQTIFPQRGRILLIDRQHYVSHPRSNPNNMKQMSRRITNLKAVKKVLQKKVPGVTHIDLVRLETLDTFADQIRMFRQAHVVIAMHGAALSHLIFMDGKFDVEERKKKRKNVNHDDNHGVDIVRPVVIELSTDYQDFFEEMARWKEVRHEILNVALNDSGEIGMYDVQKLIGRVAKAIT